MTNISEYTKYTITNTAVDMGDFVIFKWLLENQFSYNHHIIMHIVRGGNIDILRWFIDTGRCKMEDDFLDCIKLIEYDTIDHAVNNGSLDMLKILLHELHFTINKHKLQEIVIMYGQLDILRWLIEEEKMIVLSKSLYMQALFYKQIHIIKWLVLQKCPRSKKITLSIESLLTELDKEQERKMNETDQLKMIHMIMNK